MPSGHTYSLYNIVVVQVDIDNFFDLQLARKASERHKQAKNPTTWDSMNKHISSDSLKEFRNTDFSSLWQGHDYVRVHLNGAVWNHFLLNNYLSAIAEKYNLLRYSMRQVVEIVMHASFSRPTVELRSFLGRQQSRLQGQFHVGLQMRLEGQWGDGHRYNGDKSNILSCFVVEVKRMCTTSTCTGNCSVFITIDQLWLIMISLVQAPF